MSVGETPFPLSYPLFTTRAGVAKLADAPDLGSGGVTPVEVRVLSPALAIRHDELETNILAGSTH